MYHNGIKQTVVPLRPRCDLAVVKVDERKKLCITTQKFIDYCNLLVAAGRKNDSMETETAAFASKKKQHILIRKR